MDKNNSISNDNFFRILRNRVPFTFAKSYSYSNRKVEMFKETVGVLEHMEVFVNDVRNMVLDEEDFACQLHEQDSLNRINSICQQFDNIRFFKNVFISKSIFISPNVDILLKHFQLLDTQLKLELLEQFGAEEAMNTHQKRMFEKAYDQEAFIKLYSIKKVQWDRNNIPIKRCSELVEAIRNDVNALNQNTVLDEKYYQSTKEANCNFDVLLEMQKSVYVLTLDIWLKNYFELLESLNIQAPHNYDFAKISAIRTAISQLSGCLSGHIKLEPDFQSGGNLHCILIFKGTKDIVEQEIINELYERLRMIDSNCSSNIEIRNWNDVIKKNYDKNAVGLIKSTQQKNIDAFKYWIIGYFFTFDKHLKFTFSKFSNNSILKNHYFHNNLNQPNNKNTLVNKGKNKISAVNNPKQISLIKLPKKLLIAAKSILTDKEREKIWRISHLPEAAQRRIRVAENYYNYNHTNAYLKKFLINCDHFIETLIHYEIKAFDCNNGVNEEVIRDDVLQKSITLLGKQFVSLHRPLFPVETPSYYLQKLNDFNILQLSEKFSVMFAQQQIPYEFVGSINTQIVGLRKQLRTPILELNNRSVIEHRAFQYRQYNRRLQSAEQYLKPILSQDCMVHRVVINLRLMDGRIEQAKFSKLFTKFLHHAQQARPLYWKVGYIGLWQEDSEGHPYIDMFLLLNHRSFRFTEKIKDILNEQWQDFVFNNIKQENDAHVEYLVEGIEVKGQMIMCSGRTVNEYASENMLIEASNKARRKGFISQVIPFFLSSEIFQSKSQYIAAKGLIKGTIPRGKNIKATNESVTSLEDSDNV